MCCGILAAAAQSQYRTAPGQEYPLGLGILNPAALYCATYAAMPAPAQQRREPVSQDCLNLMLDIELGVFVP